MKDKFLDTVADYDMFQPGDRVAAGISGGADSMCMLSLLFECAQELGITVTAVHVNHGIRGKEADDDEAYVRSFCKDNDIPFLSRFADIPSESAKTGESTELCARRIRYEIFDSIGADKIATAHTGTDRVETMLMNLSRGSGLHGLCSIPAVRGNIVRPLVDFTREETESYCKNKNIRFVTDSTNLSDDYTRNKFRHNIIPKFSEINGAFENNVLRCISLLKRDDDYLDNEAKKKFRDLYNAEKKELDAEGTFSAGDCIGRRILMKFLSETTGSDFELKHIDLLFEHLTGKYALTLPSGTNVRTDGKKVCIFHRGISEIPEEIDIPIKDSCKVVFGRYRLFFRCTDNAEKEEHETVCVDLDKIDNEIKIRTRHPGDAITLPKRRCTKTLKKYLNETGVPPSERDQIPVLCDGRGMIAVGGLTEDASRSPDKNTKNFLFIKTECDKND